MDNDDVVRRLRSTLAQPAPAGVHPRQVETAALSALSKPDGALLLAYLESLTLRTVHPPGTPDAVLQYREGMRYAVWLMRHLMERGAETHDEGKQDRPRSRE